VSDPVRERFDSLRARLIQSPAVSSFHYHREEAVGDVGYFRVRCILLDGSELQLAERIRAIGEALAVEKYSFHWQRRDGTAICRWDNAPHHRDLTTFPHHIHEGGDGEARDHVPVDAFEILSEIEKRLAAV